MLNTETKEQYQDLFTARIYSQDWLGVDAEVAEKRRNLRLLSDRLYELSEYIADAKIKYSLVNGDPLLASDDAKTAVSNLSLALHDCTEALAVLNHYVSTIRSDASGPSERDD